MRNIKAAFHWIMRILKKHRVPYLIEGGLAAEIYGAKRKLLDIDIDIPEKKFKNILADVKKYIVFGPEQYRGEGFDIFLMTLKYRGQLIDVAASRAKLFDKKKKRWVPADDNLHKYRTKIVFGERVRIIPKKDLIVYKSKLRRRVDKIDIREMTRVLDI
ncbi:MAG: hypothetical protein HYT98_01600 [Candidatus Sungbacteria bacterium]|nr:hypothetical protein [Candidatus Sungbacteria bacterium]